MISIFLFDLHMQAAYESGLMALHRYQMMNSEKEYEHEQLDDEFPVEDSGSNCDTEDSGSKCGK